MHRIVILLFTSVFFLDFLSKYGMLPRQATWFPDALSAVVLVAVIFLIVRQRTITVSITYLIVFFILLVEIVFAIILNNVQSGAVFQGIKSYIKYLPFFLLPLAYKFTDKQISTQLKVVLAFTLLQFPITLLQRFVVSAGSASGDEVRGTFFASSILSIFLICAISMCLAFFLKKRISVKLFVLFCFLFLLPTTINETKGTLFLLPFGLLIPLFYIGTTSEKIKRLIGAFLIGTIFLSIFIPVYDHFRTSGARDEGIIEFFTTEGRLEGYLAPQSSGLRTNLGPGRLDILINPFKEFSDDPTKLIFGLGIGNASKSFLGTRFSGDYLDEYGGQMYISLSNLLWEFGVLGTFLALFWWYLIYKDARYLSKNDSIAGTIALGWIGILAVLTLSLVYKNIIQSGIVSYLFWYFSGYIAAKAYELKLQANQKYRHKPKNFL